MADIELTRSQLEIIEKPLNSKVFLEGPTGCGKTTVGVERVFHWMQHGIPARHILVLLPQRTLAQPYLDALNRPGAEVGGQVTLLTLGGLARRMIELFWPLVAEKAGFAQPHRAPVFLTLETAQYYMAQVVGSLLETGYFESVSIQPGRLYSQIIDNLNKAALVGFPHNEIGERLKAAWSGPAVQKRIYDDAQECANRFRQYCLNHNLLDFSLQIELFTNYLWADPICHNYLIQNYQFIVADNLEEESPRMFDLLRNWLPQAQSALVIYDQDGGFRTFLGADPQTTYALKDSCAEQITLEGSFVVNREVDAVSQHLVSVLADRSIPLAVREPQAGFSLRSAVELDVQRYYPQMLDLVAQRVTSLVKQDGIDADQIVVLAPYVSDALRFSMIHRMQNQDIPIRSHRPSRPLRDEPVAQCMFTLAYLAHPDWIEPAGLSLFDFTTSLVQAIEGLDLVRAHLLSQIVFRNAKGVPSLSSFERIQSEMQERITFLFGQRYEKLRLWLENYRQGQADALDTFFSRLFGELLSQPGFGFHANLNAGEVVANLVESVQKFRWAAESHSSGDHDPIGKQYLLMVRQGIVAAQYLRSWQEENKMGVLLAPAYTFLLSNRAVEVQLWLDIGSAGWFERIAQPLTQPYVLSRRWLEGSLWSDEHEQETSRQVLYRLILGLLRRCRRKVILYHSELNEQGYEQRGQLLHALQRVLQSMPLEDHNG